MNFEKTNNNSFLAHISSPDLKQFVNDIALKQFNIEYDGTVKLSKYIAPYNNAGTYFAESNQMIINPLVFDCGIDSLIWIIQSLLSQYYLDKNNSIIQHFKSSFNKKLNRVHGINFNKNSLIKKQ